MNKIGTVTTGHCASKPSTKFTERGNPVFADTDTRVAFMARDEIMGNLLYMMIWWKCILHRNDCVIVFLRTLWWLMMEWIDGLTVEITNLRLSQASVFSEAIWLLSCLVFLRFGFVFSLLSARVDFVHLESPSFWQRNLDDTTHPLLIILNSSHLPQKNLRYLRISRKLPRHREPHRFLSRCCLALLLDMDRCFPVFGNFLLWSTLASSYSASHELCLHLRYFLLLAIRLLGEGIYDMLPLRFAV